VQFSGALTLTHNATSLILPGGASITTAAGDVAYFVSLGSGNWRCTGYQKANGQAVVSSGGSPAGSSGNLQYNNAGAFGAVTGSSVSGANVTLGGSITATQLVAPLTNNTNVITSGSSSSDYSIRWITPSTFAFINATNSAALTIYAGQYQGASVLFNGANAVRDSNGGIGALNSTFSAYQNITAARLFLSGAGGINLDTAWERGASGRMDSTDGAGNLRDVRARSLISSGGTITLSNYTVATLPTAASNTHAIVAVTDGNASPTYRGAVTGGGSTKGVVYCDGSSWMWH